FNTPHTRRDEERAHQEALRLLQFVGLKGRGDILARNLAYGEQRRLEIGRALATQPKLLMLDEPTAGMNPRETSEMMEFIHTVRDEARPRHQDRRRATLRGAERSEGHRSLSRLVADGAGGGAPARRRKARGG